MIADMESNEKISHIVNELFLRGRILNISLLFISQSLFQSAENYKTKCDTLFYHENS